MGHRPKLLHLQIYILLLTLIGILKIFHEPDACKAGGIVNYGARHKLTRPPASQAYLSMKIWVYANRATNPDARAEGPHGRRRPGKVGGNKKGKDVRDCKGMQERTSSKQGGPEAQAATPTDILSVTHANRYPESSTYRTPAKREE